MKLQDVLPEALGDYFRLVRVRRRYPASVIDSALIHEGARIGNGCRIGRGVEIGPTAGIGDHSYVNPGSVIASGTIGKFCSIAYNCQIGLPRHPTDHVSTSPRFYGPSNLLDIPQFYDPYDAPPRIGNDVWIGSQALVMQGVTVGDGAVIAAAAVVTKDVAPYSIVAGIPAKKMRDRFGEREIAYLLDLKWWDLPLEELRRMKPMFLAKADWWRAVRS